MKAVNNIFVVNVVRKYIIKEKELNMYYILHPIKLSELKDFILLARMYLGTMAISTMVLSSWISMILSLLAKLFYSCLKNLRMLLMSKPNFLLLSGALTPISSLGTISAKIPKHYTPSYNK